MHTQAQPTSSDPPWQTQKAEIIKDWYTTTQPIPDPWDCTWNKWRGVHLFADGTFEEEINRPFGITGRIEPLVFIPSTCEYFMFAVDGQYYECFDFDIYRFDTPFASHDDFVHNIPPMEVCRAISTNLEPLPEMQPLPESDEEDDMESDTDEDFALDGDEVGTGSSRCKL
ncbi:hypothetical protein C8J57DRAFT_1333374 [Mycena rebaudengoi]|nr:hypothetical protein C8J57DRAFT_1333374 [Mycena rebaudengoi]